MYQILIVEDDHALNTGIALALKSSNDRFLQCYNLAEANHIWKTEKIDLVILDVNLPDGSGYDFLEMIRRESGIPVLMLTANDMEMDEVRGLSLGADDYMTKPFHLAVLRARIEGLKRRGQRIVCQGRQVVYRLDEFVFDFDKFLFTCQGRELVLSRNEQKLLRLFLEHQGQVLTRETLMDRLWTDGAEYVDENALSVTVNRLRKKLKGTDTTCSYIQTIYGLGYMWERRV